MRAELLIWALIPAVIALSLIALATWIVATKRTLPLIGLGVSTAALSGWALWMLYRTVVLKSWPTALPHLAIGLATMLAAAQLWFARRGNGTQ